ncbi:hypothetical protein [Candidatus Carsonella ruddii]
MFRCFFYFSFFFKKIS